MHKQQSLISYKFLRSSGKELFTIRLFDTFTPPAISEAEANRKDSIRTNFIKHHYDLHPRYCKCQITSIVKINFTATFLYILYIRLRGTCIGRVFMFKKPLHFPKYSPKKPKRDRLRNTDFIQFTSLILYKKIYVRYR